MAAMHKGQGVDCLCEGPRLSCEEAALRRHSVPDPLPNASSLAWLSSACSFPLQPASCGPVSTSKGALASESVTPPWLLGQMVEQQLKKDYCLLWKKRKGLPSSTSQAPAMSSQASWACEAPFILSLEGPQQTEGDTTLVI